MNFKSYIVLSTMANKDIREMFHTTAEGLNTSQPDITDEDTVNTMP